MSMKTIRRAFISVSDKTGLVELARALEAGRVEIISTGGTLKALQAAGIRAVPVDQYTGFPEILEGRLKSLHPKIHGGLLYRRDKKAHEKQARQHGILPIDLVAVNLYPFEQVVGDPKVDLETAIENIDIGGPTLLRSGAKNFDAVAVICDPQDYPEVIREMKEHRGAVSLELRRRLALKVFQRTAAYDRAISSFLGTRLETGPVPAASELPAEFRADFSKSRVLRYGENPHQRAALYTRRDSHPQLTFQQLHGKDLSFNNLMDMDGVIDVLREFTDPAACVVKHTNPCGVAENADVTKALELAIECDAMSAFGGILGINRPCGLETARTAMDRLPFFEVFVAPSFNPAALACLQKRKNLRLITAGTAAQECPYNMRFLKSGLLLQDRDEPVEWHLNRLKKGLRTVTKKKLSASEIDDLIFAWKCVKVVKSNAIVITQGRQTVGIGAGQMSRVDSVEIACRKAGYRTEGGILASDAFFPMPDSIETAAEHKVRAIIQPGGSVRDADVIAACDRLGIAMIFTGERHFRH